MKVSGELAQLAHLLKVSARTVRLIASVDTQEAAELDDIARRIDVAAERLDELATSHTETPSVQ